MAWLCSLSYAYAAFDALAFAFVMALTPFLIRRVWPFWWSVVLRRPPLPRWWAFDLALDEHAAEFRRQGERAMAALAERDRVLRMLAPKVARLRRKRAPNAKWATLRDDLADWEDARLDRVRRGDPGFDDMSGPASEITARRDALRSQPMR